MCHLGNELSRPAEDYYNQALDRPAQKTSLLARALHFNSDGSQFQEDRTKHCRKRESTPPAELFFTLVTKAADTNV
jgi:hypothetical protein